MDASIFDMTAITYFEKDVTKEDPVSHQMNKEKEQTATAEVFGIFASADDPNAKPDSNTPVFAPKLGVLRLYGDATQLLSILQKGKQYRLNCTVTPQDDFYKLSINNTFDDPEEIEIPGLPAPKDLIVQMFEPFEVLEAQYHQGVMKLLHCRIKNGKTALSAKGKNIGHMTVTDVNTQFGGIPGGGPGRTARQALR
jgi:hypothetical protein